MQRPAAQWSGTSSVKGSSEPVQMVLLTFSLIGISFCWSLEATYCTPYLLSLGLSKSKTSLVFVAGPLSGLLMQPIIGAIADKSTSRYGRRRPFMVGGAIVVGFCFLLLGWTREVVALVLGSEASTGRATIALAVLAIYVVDFAINAVQACSRSLIVDTLPISQQQSGSAWASRVGGLGSLASYGVGTLDLVGVAPPWLAGDTQFKKMILISVAMIWIATGVTCYAVTERVLVESSERGRSLWGIVASICHRMADLPRRVQAICWVQFWAGIGWFPFMFYSSTWVGETYYRYEHEPDPNEDKHDALGNIGRLGSVSLVLFSIVGFASAVLLPYVVQSSKEGVRHEEKYTPRLPRSLPQSLQKLLLIISELPQPDLVTAWQLAHLAFAFIMIWAPFVRSLAFATLLVALCGVPSAVGGWAPFAEMGIEINRLSGGTPIRKSRRSESMDSENSGYSAVRMNADEVDFELLPPQPGRPRSLSVLRMAHSESGGEDGSTGELAGVYLGVLNVYTVLPQFVSTLISWVVFSIFEPNRSGLVEGDPEHQRWLDTKGVNGISVCFFVGALCALVAAEAARRLKKLS